MLGKTLKAIVADDFCTEVAGSKEDPEHLLAASSIAVKQPKAQKPNIDIARKFERVITRQCSFNRDR